MLGAGFGSIFTIIIYRVPSGVPLMGKHNFCPSCEIKLKAVDLIPIISYLKLGGRCSCCNAVIPKKYLIIEVVTATYFVILYLIYGVNFDFMLYSAFWSMLLITFVIDLEHMVISDAVLAMFFPIVIVYIIATGASFAGHLIGLAAGFIFFLVIYSATKWAYKREAFGFGDVMLSGAVGWFLGPENAILTGIMSFLLAFIVIIILKILRKNITKDMEIPFGPFICVAAVISSLWGEEIIKLYWDLGYLWS